MNSYTRLKRTHEHRLNEYLSKYAFFAFSEEQTMEGLKKLNATTEDIIPLGGGGFILRDRARGFRDILRENDAEMKAALSDPEHRSKFAYDMFYAELVNYEYGYTGDEEESLNALGLTREEVEQSEVLSTAFKKAKMKLMEEF